MSEAIKPTPEMWVVYHDDVVVRVKAGSDTLYEVYLPEYDDEEFAKERAKAIENAQMIADAGNVFNDTGLTPRQLADRLKDVETAMRDAREMIEADHVDAAYQMLGEAISKLVEGSAP